MNLLHFNVVCSDFDTSYDFYTNVVGMRPLTSSRAGTDAGASRSAAPGVRPGEGRAGPGDGKEIAELLGFEGTGEYRGCFLYFGSTRSGAYLDLLEWKDNEPPVARSPRNIGLARVAIRVDDLDEQLARLAQHGVPTLSEPKELVLGVTRVRVVCFRDPDGVLLEYLEFADQAWGTR
jgi:catechol 2,3-dioxygenase-like lactoylglutathione lyase family enzyme